MIKQIKNKSGYLTTKLKHLSIVFENICKLCEIHTFLQICNNEFYKRQTYRQMDGWMDG